MYIKDLIFDGESLSDYGCVVATFNGGNSNTYTLGGNVEFVTNDISQSNRLRVFNSAYTETLSTTLQIVKCDNSFFNYQDMSDISKWLNRNDNFKKLEIHSDDPTYPSIYHMAQINVSAITSATRIIGLELSITTDRPWGNLDKMVSGRADINTSVTLLNNSDHFGDIPATYTIVPLENGNLTISNSLLSKKIVISGCAINEIINIDGYNQIITSTSPNVPKRFNFEFPVISNTTLTSENKITTSLPCSITCSWTEIKKVGIGI